jgi:hypothetical protein
MYKQINKVQHNTVVITSKTAVCTVSDEGDGRPKHRGEGGKILIKLEYAH